MTIHTLLIIVKGTLVSVSTFSGAEKCGEAMPALVAAIEAAHGPADAYCVDTGRPDTRPRARL